MLTILLQAATGLNTDGILNTFMNQGPSVALLIIAIVALNKRNTAQTADIKALNDKVEQYMSEDRAKMQAVIENNTAVMLQLQQFLNQKSNEKIN